MSVFSYAARDASGKRVAGTVDAPDAQAAHASLRSQELQVEELRETERFANPDPESEWEIGEGKREYLPLSDTMRLYAGWLLALYFVVYALGSYQWLGNAPLSLGFVDELFLSPLILAFSVAAFLYLLLHTVFRWLGGGAFKGIVLGAIGVVLFLAFRANM